jgi:hypothetical protein
LPVEVSGLGYFEHAWGFIPAIDVANRTLLNFQLRDGRDIYAAELRDRADGNEFTAAFGYVSGRGGNPGHDPRT